jgi:DNA-binding response OmpR family regulator
MNTFSDSPQLILVVDDDLVIQRIVAEKLRQSGFEVFTASSGEEALNMVKRAGLPNLAIIDISMPGMDGIELCKRLQESADLPVVFLTGVTDEATVVSSIEQYAEDYIRKPVSPAELAARVKRILSRVGQSTYQFNQPVQVDDHLTVDLSKRRITVGGKDIKLTPIEAKILHILMQHAGQVVTSDVLLRRIWPLEEIFADTLRVHVHRLRQKIETNPSLPDYIITERNQGYRFPIALPNK